MVPVFYIGMDTGVIVLLNIQVLIVDIVSEKSHITIKDYNMVAVTN